MNGANLCLVEDDPTIRELVAEKLRSVGYQVDTFASADSLLVAGKFSWELYILDIMLEGEASGLDLCKAIRHSNPTVPVLLLSALSDPSDRVEGLKLGADDYLTKPFEMEELLLRVAGMLKRRSWYSRLPEDVSIFQWGENSVDFVRFEGRHSNQQFVLSQKECMVLKLLIEREDEVVSRDEILDQVWGYDVYPSSRTVDNFILRLRKYFDNPGNPKYIHSIRGTGYKFTSKGMQ